MGQSVSRRPLTTETRVRSQASACGINGGQKVLWQVFLPVLLLPPVSIIPPLLLSYLHLYVALRRTNRGRLGTFQKAVFLRKFGSTGQKGNFTECEICSELST